MRDEIIKCDRCRKNITYSMDRSKIYRSTSMNFIPDIFCKHPIPTEIDLCRDCADAFAKFLRGGDKNEKGIGFDKGDAE